MALVLLIGGARSGKSETAQRLATEQDDPVVFVATGEAGDEEMAARIEGHRRARPAAWRTIEEPLRLRATIEAVGADDCLVLDCLTLWSANALDRLGAAQAAREARAAAAAAAARPGLTIAVTNEVGLGLVPDNELGRAYRDLHGQVNAIWAAAADQAFLLVAGRLLALEGVDSLSAGLQ
jgi:adenosylcobinamide kinase/adenosylcobinamide-phosphate guanylyltransferase